MGIQDTGIELFGVCDDNSCTSSAERVVPFTAPATQAWETIAVNLSDVYGVTITVERALEMASQQMTWVAEMLAAVKAQMTPPE